MPTEQFIRKKAVENLRKDGWITWYPYRIRYKQNDIFGIIDLLAIKRKRQKNIQLTTLPNISTKRKKITNFLKNFKVELPVEIWAWSKKEKKFRKEKIQLKIKKRPKKLRKN